MRRSFRVDGQMQGTVLMAILRDEWESTRAVDP
jgi:hypothetical protein